jgi:hypothetical protein
MLLHRLVHRLPHFRGLREAWLAGLHLDEIAPPLSVATAFALAPAGGFRPLPIAAGVLADTIAASALPTRPSTAEDHAGPPSSLPPLRPVHAPPPVAKPRLQPA